MTKLVVRDLPKTIEEVLEKFDTDGDKKITILDIQKIYYEVDTSDNEKFIISSTYHLSNFLQEMYLELEKGKTEAHIPIHKVNEKPADRMSRLIKEYYWNGMTRTLDKEGISQLIDDSKNKKLQKNELTIYVPYSDERAFDYYKSIENELPIKVEKLPKEITREFVESLNEQPGILTLDLEQTPEGLKGKSFPVPGGRFNEMYGWDSYFIAIGLLLDGQTQRAKNIAEHFAYEIKHYGKILNANRSYYLTRTHPPFYSSLVREIFEYTKDRQWLAKQLPFVIQEYENVWMQKPRRVEGELNRYHAQGMGITIETEEGHYHAVLKPYAKEMGISIEEYERKYRAREIVNEDLAQYFIHDRSVRESGHDSSYRLEGKCTDLAPVELNVLLYQYEMDLAHLIEKELNDSILVNGKNYNSEYFKHQAALRKAQFDEYFWNEEKGFYFDYHLKNKKQENFISATGMFPLWAHLSSPEQAKRAVEVLMNELKEQGGIVSGTEESRGEISSDRPAKQWDYPYGWAPHQMVIWKGLKNYGFNVELQELVYRWLYMITKNAADYSGTTPEKYDVVEATHLVFVEYGNVGTDFEYISKEGFGWMNASFQLGLQYLEAHLKEKLNQLVPPEKIFL